MAEIEYEEGDQAQWDALAISYGLKADPPLNSDGTNPTEYWFTNKALWYHHTHKAEGGIFMCKTSEQRLADYLAERRVRDYNARPTNPLVAIGWFLGGVVMLTLMLGALILMFAWPPLAVMFCVGGVFATMGGDGDMPEKK